LKKRLEKHGKSTGKALTGGQIPLYCAHLGAWGPKTAKF